MTLFVQAQARKPMSGRGGPGLLRLHSGEGWIDAAAGARGGPAGRGRPTGPRVPLATRAFLAYPWAHIMAIALNITSLSPDQLRKAADLLEQIQGLREQLNQLLGGELPAAPVAVEVPEPAAGPGKARKKFSAQTRAKMAAAQKARWAAKTGVSVARPIEVKAEEAPPAKKKASPALLKALAKARKARWAKVRAAN